MSRNVPTLTKAVRPMENRSLTSSTCLVLRWRLRIVHLPELHFAAGNAARHCDGEKAVRSLASVPCLTFLWRAASVPAAPSARGVTRSF